MKLLPVVSVGAALCAAIGSAHAVYTPADTFLFSAEQVGGNDPTSCAASAAPNETLKGSGDSAEANCLAQHLGLADGSLLTDIKDASFNFFFNGKIGGVDSWFIDIAPEEPGYFLLKYGEGGTGVDSHYYFQNVADYTKLVWTSTQVNGLLVGCNTTEGQECSNSGFRLSHFATYGNASSSGLASSSSGLASSSGNVPEPSSSLLAMVGLGLVGGSFLLRRRAGRA